MSNHESINTDRNEKITPLREFSANEMMSNSKIEVNTAQQMEQKAVRRHINKTEDGGHYVDIQDSVHKNTSDIVNTIPCRVNGIKEYNLSDETVLYFMESETVHSLNSSAKAIWELCDGSNSIAEISQKLGKRFGCSGTELLSDVTATITELKKLSLLELKNASRTKST